MAAAPSRRAWLWQAGAGAAPKHRIFSWLRPETLPDSALIAVARDDDFMLGVLHSRVHELWARAMGTQLETRSRYTPTTTFETFPFPRPTTPEQSEAINEAARELDRLRAGWLNPPGLSTAELNHRTLTNLYNVRPQWLIDAHDRLDVAVLDAYGWPAGLADDEILARLLDLNLARSAAEASPADA
jgi:type II restriction/modification system DNA methylase subunit YeeA